ncbi:MAG: SDR family NAD(P)-dependent oxidoreductase [Deltaproteobacteria bacterium]|nr:SDR family NAD(P)-dependent oxidoreductase [Deltaproteobacteria bacterium]
MVVFITGASSGIGEALARAYIEAGAQVALVARRTDRLEGLCKEFNTSGVRAIALTADVTKDGDLEAAVAKTVQAFGRIDVVIANAGFAVIAHFTKLTLADYRRQLETNVFGALRTAYATVPELAKSKGSLAFVGSVAAFLPLPTGSAYAMSKAAVMTLSEALRLDLAPLGVSVTHIAPGFITTEIRRVTNAGTVSDTQKDPVPLWLQMPADVAAKKIVRAIRRRQRELVLTLHGKFGVFIGRHFYGFTAFVMAIVAKRTGKKLGLDKDT